MPESDPITPANEAETEQSGSGTTIVDEHSTAAGIAGAPAGEQSGKAADSCAEAPTELSETAPDQADGIRIGAVVASRYRLEKVLGEGGMGRVFLATDTLYSDEFQDRQDKVALKFLGAKFAQHSISRIALQRETRKSQQLSHPNVVRVMHFDQHAGTPYMIMEYLEGLPLDEFLRASRGVGRPLAEALPLVEDMASGLDYIHAQGLVHLDFKPGNVFVSSAGSAKILDLGIARLHAESRSADQETAFDVSALGAMTPSYASCEMFERLDPDPRDDVYALACVAYELLTGKHPFDNQPAIKARAAGHKPVKPEHIDRSRWRALLKGLAFDRTARTPSARDFAEDLRGEKSSRKRVLLGLAGVAALAVASASILALQAMQPVDPDAAFLARLSALSEGAPPLSVDDEARIQAWLEQGDAYRGIADEVFNDGDILSAHQILQVGADNASAAYRSVLELTPSERAQQGMLAITALYARWADEKLESGSAVHSLWMACHGLSLHPGSTRLQEVAEEARDELGTATNTDCVFMREQTP